MAFLSTFDPWLKQKELQNNKNKFGKDNVMLVQRSLLFAIIKIGIPFIFSLLILWLILWLTEIVDKTGAVLTYVWLPLTILIVVVMVYRLSKVYIDYTMDFTIVTPEQIVSLDQDFLLSRKTQSMQTSKIKTVTINKSWLLYSIFNNGDISFLSEWDQSLGEINLFWIHNPEKVKKRVLEIVDTARKMEEDAD